MIAVLNTVSAGMIEGSARFSVIVTVLSSVATTSWIELIRNPQMPLSGVEARFSDQTTSSAVIGLPSENWIPSRRVSVTVLASSETVHSVARPGSTLLPSALGMSSVSYMLDRTQISTFASFRTGSRNRLSA